MRRFRRCAFLMFMIFVTAVIITADLPSHVRKAIEAAENKAPLTFQMLSASRGGYSSRADGFTVMTFNIHHGRDINDNDSLDGIVQEIRSSGAQIVALQEVDRYMPRSGFKNQVKYIAQKLSMSYAYGETIDLLGIEYGNALLSAFPILKQENIKLPYEGLEPRGLLKTQVQVMDDVYNVWVTHLGLSQQERIEQVEAINGELKQIDGKTILLGDFNNIASSYEMKMMSDKLKDVAALVNKSDINTYVYGSILPNTRIDYIWITDDLCPEDYRVNPLGVSDHASVVAKLLPKEKKKL